MNPSSENEGTEYDYINERFDEIDEKLDSIIKRFDDLYHDVPKVLEEHHDPVGSGFKRSRTIRRMLERESIRLKEAKHGITS